MRRKTTGRLHALPFEHPSIALVRAASYIVRRKTDLASGLTRLKPPARDRYPLEWVDLKCTATDTTRRLVLLSVERFGAPAPGDVVLRELRVHRRELCKRARALRH